jgi:hypothetical protein
MGGEECAKKDELSSQAAILKYCHCSLFIVDCSFIIAGAAPFHNDK